MPDVACTWIRTVPPLAPHHVLTREVWPALVSHPRDWMTAPRAQYPPGPVLEQLTGPTPKVRNALHTASAQTDQLTGEVWDLALEPLRVLYPQAHIPPAGTSNRLACLGLQHRVEAAHTRGVVGQWLTLRNPSTVEGHWYLHQLVFLPQTAPEHRRQDLYDTHLVRLGAQSFPQPAPPAGPAAAGPGGTAAGAPARRDPSRAAKGAPRRGQAEPDRTNCGLAAWTAACRHLAWDTTGLRPCGWRTAQRWRPRWRSSPWGSLQTGRHAWCPTFPARVCGPANPPRHTHQRRPSRRKSCTLSRRRCWRTAGKALSTTTARRRSRAASRGRNAMRPTRGAPHSVSAPAWGTRTAEHPLLDPSSERHW